MDSGLGDKDLALVVAIAAAVLGTGLAGLVHKEWWSGGLFTALGLAAMAPASPFVKSHFPRWALGPSALWTLAVVTWLFLAIHVALEVRVPAKNASFASPFTVTGIGCSPTNATGNGAAGTFTLAPGPCTAVMVTLGSPAGSPNGWHCNVGDRTQLAKGSFIPQWIESASTKTTVTIPIPRATYQGDDLKPNAGTDVISFACTAY